MNNIKNRLLWSHAMRWDIGLGTFLDSDARRDTSVQSELEHVDHNTNAIGF